MRVGIIIIAITLLTGCSVMSAISDLLPSKDGIEATAQVGESNQKTGVGLSNQTDKSSSTESDMRNSTNRDVDSSSQKKTAATGLSANTITAEKIEIHSTENSGVDSLVWGVLAGLVSGMITYFALRFARNKKGA
ncbi:Rz-like spanin [Escherichia phage vB_EcoS_AHP42]|uniref:Rz1 protein n=1 Tax=Escherichia phage vB_EcoS_AHP42 TaxID=1416028 RepID=A0A067YXL7_9CAUD|nr:Rz-like spanin [Escherichia phage vB_EcoS_AHP42]AHI60598.1 Rz1 protein [Escherichia phage vB_EcoS_AHP42]